MSNTGQLCNNALTHLVEPVSVTLHLRTCIGVIHLCTCVGEVLWQRAVLSVTGWSLILRSAGFLVFTLRDMH